MMMEIGKYYSLNSSGKNNERIDYVIKILDIKRNFFVIKYFNIDTNFFCSEFNYEMNIYSIIHEISEDIYFSYIPDNNPDKIPYLRKQKIKSLIG